MSSAFVKALDPMSSDSSDSDYVDSEDDNDSDLSQPEVDHRPQKVDVSLSKKARFLLHKMIHNSMRGLQHSCQVSNTSILLPYHLPEESQPEELRHRHYEDLQDYLNRTSGTKIYLESKQGHCDRLPLNVRELKESVRKNEVSGQSSNVPSGPSQEEPEEAIVFAGQTVKVEGRLARELATDGLLSQRRREKRRRDNAVLGSHISHILNNLNSTRKLSTADKSKLDWRQYKREHRLSHEALRGEDVIGKQRFLMESDAVKFELDLNLRRQKRLFAPKQA